MHVDLNLYSFVQLKFSVYGHTYWTYTRILQSSHASVGLAQARPNKGSIVASNLHIVEKAKKVGVYVLLIVPAIC